MTLNEGNKKTEMPEVKRTKFRHEFKYEIDFSDYMAIKSRIRQVMHSDPNCDENGRYLVRSIYFDNYKDKAVYEKRSGIQKREKFRIRYYNDDFSEIKLEKKQKYNGLCMKMSARLSREECEKIITGDTGWMKESNDPLIKELYVKMKTQVLRPRVVVSYIREPYVYKAGNTRVTFDSNIKTSLYSSRFMDEQLLSLTTEDVGGRIIMEVKYDEYIPDIISSLLQMGNLRKQSFSKYTECRKFG